MLASEDDIGNFKLDILKKQLGITSTVEEHQSKNCDQNSMRIYNSNEKFSKDESNSKLLIQMLNNSQSCKKNPVDDNREKYHRKKTLKNGNLGEIKYQQILNEILEQIPQVVNDALNNLLKRSYIFSNKCHSSGREATDSLNVSFSEERSSDNCSQDNDIKELTHVKEALASQSMSDVDISCNKYPLSLESEYFGSNMLDPETVNEYHSGCVLPPSKICYDSIDERKMFNTDECPNKYTIDIMETEKNNSADKKDLILASNDVEEKYDVEKAESCHKKIGVAEFQNMIDPEPLSNISHWTQSLSIAPCFLSSMSESVCLENFNLKSIYSLESCKLSVDNWLSLEWLTPRNFCYHCNIIASRQTNMPSVLFSGDKTFCQSSIFDRLSEGMEPHFERKACNLITVSDSVDLNVCKASLAKQYDNKGIIAMMNTWSNEFTDPENKHIFHYNKKESIGMWSVDKIEENFVIEHNGFQGAFDSLERLKYLQYVNDKKSVQKETGECNDEVSLPLRSIDKQEPEEKFEGLGKVEDSFEQVCIVGKKIGDSCRDSFKESDKNWTKIDDILDFKDFGQARTEISISCSDIEDLSNVWTNVNKSCRGFDNFESGSASLQNGADNILEEMKDLVNVDKYEQTGGNFRGLPYFKNKNEYADKHDNKNMGSIGELKYLDNRCDDKGLWDQEVKDKYRMSSYPETQGEDKKSTHNCENDDLGMLSQDQGRQKRNGKEIVDEGCCGGSDEDITKHDLIQDKEGNIQDNCQRVDWSGETFKKFSSSTSKKEGYYRREKYFTKMKFIRDKKKFAEKFGYDKHRANVFPNKIKSKERSSKQKRRNHVKFKWEKLASGTNFSCGGLLCVQKNCGSLKRKHCQNFRKIKGKSHHLNKDTPVRLNLVKAKVSNRSGGDGGHGNSNRSSANEKQRDGNQSSNREAGSGRQSGNGNGSNSGGDGNQNNNNENNLNKTSTSEKVDSKSKKSKSKNGKELNLSEQVASLPSLPTPKLDPDHVARRRVKEMTMQDYEAKSVQMLPTSGSSIASNQSTGLEAASESADMENIQPKVQEASSIQHSVAHIDQLCDIIGDSTNGLPSEIGIVNVCLTYLTHDLTLAANENYRAASCDSCNVCLIFSQLLIHQANPGHDGFVKSCDQCAQIFNLTMRHCIDCIQVNRPKIRRTQSDLCYKICKYLQWNVNQLSSCDIRRLRSKVQKYCDKVLGRIEDTVSLRYLQGDPAQFMAEIGIPALTDHPSTGMSSSTTLSLNGNIVTTETGEQDQIQTCPEETQLSSASVNVPVVIPPAILPSSVTASCSGIDSPSHMRLTRKPSQQRKTPAIPPPIVEENQPLDHSLTAFASGNTAEGKTDDIENIIIQRYGSRIDDPYETQKTYGEKNQYGSLPLGNVHDVAQFLSVSTRPLGVPGIGEVVFAHPSQLRIVASFWDKKREECERTQTCPYQHREEGVILAEQRDNFSILHTRYQKHHQWERVSHLGNGMSGKCHLAIDMNTNFQFCCKKIHLLRYAEEELSLWSEMHNAYIVRLYGAIRHGVKIYIFSEFIDGGSLAACIEEQKRLGRRLSHWSAINYFQQLLKVLAFLQKKNILHEDIKADNILLRRNTTYLAVTDFGTSRRLQDPKELKNKSPVGSQTHWSPEKASMEGHGFPSDLWAAVCVLVHMFSGEPPWVKRFLQTAGMLNYVIYFRSPPMEDVPDNVQLVVRDLIERGFAKDPQVRPSSSELLQHHAFSILDKGKPETYFSTLTSMAHSGLHANRMASAGAGEQQDINKEELPSNTLDSVHADVTVLFETNIHRGPYQESDSRPDNINQQSCERQEAKSHEDQAESNENDHEGTESNSAEDVQAAGSPDETATLTPNPVTTLIEGNQTVVASNVDAKVNQLVGQFDINDLLPQFNELFVSGDSLNTQSIKYFFTDSYSTRDLLDARQSNLQVYKPEERTDELPNLSIFDASWEITTQQKEVMPSSVPAIRTRFLSNQSLPHSQLNFMLSSESDDCTSADLFEFDPVARNSETAQNAGSSVDAYAKNGMNSQEQNVFPPGDVSPTVSTGSNLSSSGTSNLQLRKPTNLTLNVDCTALSSGLSRSHSDTQPSSAISANEIEQKHRSSTWTQLSSSANSSSHLSSSTPSSSHAAPTPRKTSGTSVPSTASSGHSQFSYHRSSVKEEQDRMIEELTCLISPYSPTSIDNDKLDFGNFLPQDLSNTDKSENEDNTDIQAIRNTILEEIDESKLVGHNLMFYGEQGNYLFTMRIEELPSDWKSLISRVRQKISKCGYVHFSINHMDNTPVKLRHPLATRQFKVINRQDPGAQCWCQECQTMY